MTLDQARGVLAAFGVSPKESTDPAIGEYANDTALLAGMAYALVSERLAGLLDGENLRDSVLTGFRFVADTHDETDQCEASGGEHACVQQGLLLLSRGWMRDSLWLMDNYQRNAKHNFLKLGALNLAMAASMLGYGFTPDGSEMEASMLQKVSIIWTQLRAVASQIGLAAVNTGTAPLPFVFVADRWDGEQWKRITQGHTASRDEAENTAPFTAGSVFAWLAASLPADELPVARVRVWAARGRPLVEIVGDEPDAVYTIDDYSRDQAEAEAEAQTADCAAADEHAEAAEAGPGYGHAATIAEGADVG
jgi:hypothetical protein